MKQLYTKPEMSFEVFVVNTSIAACTITAENASLMAVCEKYPLGGHPHPDGETIRDVHEAVNILGISIVTGFTYDDGVWHDNLCHWNDTNGDKVLSEGDEVIWIDGHRGTLQSTQNHS